MKRVCSLILSMAIIMVLCCPACATSRENVANDDLDNATITTFLGDDGLWYEYVKYSNPVTYEYDGTTHTLLGTVRRCQSISTYDNYHYWTTWSIIDNGITQRWVTESNPYFITSVARGQEVSGSIKKEITLSPMAGIRLPEGSQSVVNTALRGDFSLGLTGNYTKTLTIKLSGPIEPEYNSRSFYYKTGFHEHNLTIIEQERSNWDGLISEKKHENCIGYEPAVKNFSEDEYVH